MIKLASCVVGFEYLNGNIYKFDKNIAWILVHYHNSTRGDYYNKDNGEVLNYKGKYKFSILGKLNEYKLNNGFEFMLEYPELGSYNHWYQTSNPVEKATVEGYRNISIAWNVTDWRGLAQSSSSSAFIDGSSPSWHWHYAIGLYTDWRGNTNSIPGPFVCGTGKICEFHEVFLWLRIPNEKLQTLRERVCTKGRVRSINYNVLIILVIAS